MVEYTTLILKFDSKGEKTGWTYIVIPADVAAQVKPGNRQTFRAKGFLDRFPFAGIALLPMGDGNFILPLNADLRKGIRKGEGAMLQVQLEEDLHFSIEMPADLEECLGDEPGALDAFYKLARSHRNYFIKWIDSAKTEPTRIKRIAATVNAMQRGLDYGAMIRGMRDDKR
ncbi:YdeI/OmpD-associated family protein [Hufsiella ginkgonis]|uniref:DUF1905 domain-containing protein n=1 Tax=Hufsiella ginkgonis TaxID=2695274 RepID=A0A7K1XVP4_9SPHI|nr:YdeI/OmpD-associated family protein [Hufsiella ginkgonis]MXV14839.1 DUF1905 domain-containing protein [Hufsiella ginkgonis]